MSYIAYALSSPVFGKFSSQFEITYAHSQVLRVSEPNILLHDYSQPS